jgi:MHS family proline/betaine transporter-like MFS transporter
MALSIPFFGRLITAWGNIKIAKTGAVCLFVFSTPLYLFFFQNSLALLITAQFMLALFLALYLSSIPAILSSCFPTKVRYTCTGLSYSLTIALFGGTAPLLNSYAIHFFDHPLIPCAYLMLAAVISFLTLRTLPPQPQ